MASYEGRLACPLAERPAEAQPRRHGLRAALSQGLLAVLGATEDEKLDERDGNHEAVEEYNYVLRKTRQIRKLGTEASLARLCSLARATTLSTLILQTWKEHETVHYLSKILII